jgi:hypothetical protein
MKYTVTASFRGMTVRETEGLTKKEAMQKAEEEIKEFSELDCDVFITFFDDGTKYLQRDGGCSVTKSAWGVVK